MNASSIEVADAAVMEAEAVIGDDADFPTALATIAVARAVLAVADELHSILLVLDSPEPDSIDELPRYRAEPDQPRRDLELDAAVAATTELSVALGNMRRRAKQALAEAEAGDG